MNHSTFDIVVSWILVCAGFVCVMSLLIALITWSIRKIVRNIVETKYAFSVKYYIQDTHNRMVDYDRRLRNMETEISEIRKQASGGKKE